MLHEIVSCKALIYLSLIQIQIYSQPYIEIVGGIREDPARDVAQSMATGIISQSLSLK